jgi:hypothetical protein
MKGIFLLLVLFAILSFSGKIFIMPHEVEKQAEPAGGCYT